MYTLTPWNNSYDQSRQHIKKQRHYFANKDLSSQGYGFPVVMCGCESCTIKKAEHRRIDAFALCCWRRLLRVPWTAKSSNQSILKEISPGCTLEGLMLTETPILWPRDAKSWLTWKDPDAGKDWGQQQKGMTEHEMDGITDLMDMCLSELRELVMDREAWCAAVMGSQRADVTEQLSWAEPRAP